MIDEIRSMRAQALWIPLAHWAKSGSKRARGDKTGRKQEMIRNLKALGLSLVAMLAMGALSASAASATDVLTVGSSPALLTGTSHNHVFELYPQGTKFECTTSKFAATAANGATETTAEVVYTGTKNVVPHTHHCSSSVGSVTIDTEGCGYVITGETTGEYTDVVGKDATISVDCEKGKEITITSSVGAVLHIPSQKPTQGGVTFTNVTHDGAHAVNINATVTGVTYTCTPTFTCTLGGIPHHGNNNTYRGDVTMTAYVDTEGLPTPVTEGARTPLTFS